MIERHPPLAARVLARTILSEKRFRVAVPSTHRTLWEMFWNWLRDLWSRLYDALFSHVHVAGRISVILGDALALALIAVVLFMFVRLVLGSMRETRRSAAARPLADRPDPLELYDRSRAAAARGDYREAIALLFRAALLRLERVGFVREDPSRTVNEWRRALAGAQPGLVPAFNSIARPFVAAFYAELPVEREEWLAARDAYAALPAERADG